MKALFILCAIMLMVATLDMPSSYYNLLRVAVTIGAVLGFILDLEKGAIVGIFVFGVLALLFNPIIPIYLHERELWIIIDILAAVFFGVKAYTYSESHKTRPRGV